MLFRKTLTIKAQSPGAAYGVLGIWIQAYLITINKSFEFPVSLHGPWTVDPEFTPSVALRGIQSARGVPIS